MFRFTSSVFHSPPWPRKYEEVDQQAKRDKACTWTRNLRFPASSSLFYTCRFYHMSGTRKQVGDFAGVHVKFLFVCFLRLYCLTSFLSLLWVIWGRNSRVFHLRWAKKNECNQTRKIHVSGSNPANETSTNWNERSSKNMVLTRRTTYKNSTKLRRQICKHLECTCILRILTLDFSFWKNKAYLKLPVLLNIFWTIFKSLEKTGNCESPLFAWFFSEDSEDYPCAACIVILQRKNCDLSAQSNNIPIFICK